MPVSDKFNQHGSSRAFYGTPRPTTLRHFLLALFFRTLSSPFAVSSLFAQDQNPLANDPKAAQLGEFQFRSNCAFCHGPVSYTHLTLPTTPYV